MHSHIDRRGKWGCAAGCALIILSFQLQRPALAWEEVPQATAAPESTRSQSSSAFKLDLKFDAFDAAQSGPGGQGFALGAKNREVNEIDDLKVSLSTLDGAMRFSLRQAESFYSADPNYLRLLASRNKNTSTPGKERFLLHDGSGGTAGLERLDVRIFDIDWMGVSTFASHRDVDPYFQSLAAEKAKDEFSVANRSTETGGGKLRFGSFSLSTSYAVSSGLSATSYGDSSGLSAASYGVSSGLPAAVLPTDARVDRSITFDLTDFRKRSGDFLPGRFWNLAPSGIYVGDFVKETSFGLNGGPPNRMSGVTAGAYWTWAGGSANVGYWNYYLDSRRTGEASYDSAGRGLDASVSLHGEVLQYYGGFSYRRSEDLAELARATDNGYDAYGSVVYKSRDWPDVRFDGAAGRYGYRSLSYAMTDDGFYWSAGLSLDFAKYFWGTAADTNAKGGTPSLRLLYRYTEESDRGTASEAHSNDHLVGMIFRMGFAGPDPQFNKRPDRNLFDPLSSARSRMLP